MAWTVRRLYPVSQDIAINRFTKGNVADHVLLPTYHIFQVNCTHAIIMLKNNENDNLIVPCKCEIVILKNLFQDVSMATTVLDAWLLLVHITLQQL